MFKWLANSPVSAFIVLSILKPFYVNIHLIQNGLLSSPLIKVFMYYVDIYLSSNSFDL